ncbi:MAG: hypothetical protein EA357_10845 [Micavibrio sp.]|nr:MAG: hypothetical protein EA357_10845 [Micavibrio sp.]
MVLFYILCGFLATALMAGIAVWPFYSLWRRLRTHHRDVWIGMGPFEIIDLVTMRRAQRNFLRIIRKADMQDTLKQRDPVLVKRAQLCRWIISFFPETVFGQIFLIFIVLATGSTLTGLLARLLS